MGITDLRQKGKKGFIDLTSIYSSQVASLMAEPYKAEVFSDPYFMAPEPVHELDKS
jgi:hypothetical protein